MDTDSYARRVAVGRGFADSGFERLVDLDEVHDALRRGPHPPVLHVERDAEVLAHHHAVGADLHGATPVGQQLGDTVSVVGQFEPRGTSGGMFLGGMVGGSAGGAFAGSMGDAIGVGAPS